MPVYLGEIDGRYPTERALGVMAGYYDIATIDISGSSDEEIDLYSVIGNGCVGIDVFDAGGADGSVLVKTLRDGSSGYVAVPILAYSRTGQLPHFRYIKKTGSVTSVVVCYQKMAV